MAQEEVGGSRDLHLLNRRTLITFENVDLLCSKRTRTGLRIVGAGLVKAIVREFLSLLQFDEEFYAKANQDVQSALQSGWLKSPFDHFTQWGFFEGRPFRSQSAEMPISRFAALIPRVIPSKLEDADMLELNFDLLKELISKLLEVVWFDEIGYLERSPDVSPVIDRGSLKSGHQHFATYGYFEGRSLASRPLVEFHPLDNPAWKKPMGYFADVAEGCEMLEVGNLAEAERLFRRALNVYKTGAQASYHLSSILVRRGRFIEALKTLQSCHAPLQEHAVVHGMEGRIASTLALPERASSAYGAAARLSIVPARQGDRYEYQRRLGHALVRRGRLREALLLFRSLPDNELGADDLAVRSSLIEIVHAHRKRLSALHAALKDRTLGAREQSEIAEIVALLGFYKVSSRWLAVNPIGSNDYVAVRTSCLAVRTAVGARAALERLLQFQDHAIQEPELIRLETQLSFESENFSNALSHPIEMRDSASRQIRCLSLLFRGESTRARQAVHRWRESDEGNPAWAALAIMVSSEQSNLRHVTVPGRGDFLEVIPKRIVQYWHEHHPPPDVSRLLTSWKEMNPDWSYSQFDAEGARLYLAEHYQPAVLLAFSKCSHPAMQADFFRLAYLAQEGGIYIDADERCVLPISKALALGDAEIMVVRNDLFYVFSSPLACVPGNLLISRALNLAISALLAKGEAKGGFDTWRDLGPGLLTRIVGTELLEVARPNSRRAKIAFLSQQDSWMFCREETLEYKRTKEGNWRL